MSSQENISPRRNTWQETVLHGIAYPAFLYVWLWHLTGDAQALPGASGFGWFFRYLTFCSFTLQLMQSGLALMTNLGQMPQLEAFVDNASCALMPLANVVTVMYYAIDAMTSGAVEGGRQLRPQWLGFMVHQGNSIYAWLDVALSSKRSFSPLSKRLFVGLALAYAGWINFIRFAAGSFPYPFLNKLPQPFGVLGTVVVAMSLGLTFWSLAHSLKKNGSVGGWVAHKASMKAAVDFATTA